jgi:RNA polymerase sigma-B factor
MATVLSEHSTDFDAGSVRGERIRSHLSLVEGIARRFDHRGEELEDLVQVGTVGLIAAVDRFRPERGSDFVAYAAPTIAGEIRRHLRDRSGTVRLPRRLYELRSRLGAAESDLAATLGRAPTAAELARALGAPEEDVARLLADRAPGPADGPDEPAGEDAYAGTEERLVVVEALRSLDERRRAIVHLRFFAGLSQAEIGARLGLSQVHVSRLLRSALAELGPRVGGRP